MRTRYNGDRALAEEPKRAEKSGVGDSQRDGVVKGQFQLDAIGIECELIDNADRYAPVRHDGTFAQTVGARKHGVRTLNGALAAKDHDAEEADD